MPSLQHAATEADAALRRARDALAAADSGGRAHEIVPALVALARCHERRREAAVAETLLEIALAWSRCTASPDLVVEQLVELCRFGVEESLRDDGSALAGAAERARAHGREAASLAASLSDPVIELHTLLRISRLHARLGDDGEAEALRDRVRRAQASARPERPERDCAGGAIAAKAHPTLQ